MDVKETNHRETPNASQSGRRERAPLGLGTCPSPGQRRKGRRGRRAEALSLFTGARVRRGSAWKAWAPHTAAGPEAARRSQQDVVLKRPGHAVDDEPPVVAEGGEEPGVG